MTQRTKSKFVFAGPSKSAETLFKLVKSLNHLIFAKIGSFDGPLETKAKTGETDMYLLSKFLFSMVA
jgi:hypothetical protein